MSAQSFVFEGGAHKHELLVELIEDLGGWIIARKILAQESTITFTIPEADVPLVREKVLELRGSLREQPLLGTEIAVVAPTIARHHLPHVLCDIAEYMRRMGSKTNMIGLARGVGQRIAQISTREKNIIEEHDAAIFVFGNFEHCLKEYKWKIYQDLTVPFVVTAGPDLKSIPYTNFYVGNVGRLPYRLRTLDEIDKLQEIANTLAQALRKVRNFLENDPPLLPSFAIKEEIERQLPEIKNIFSPTPIVPQLRGLRIKLPFYQLRDKIANIKIGDYLLKEIADIHKSNFRDYVLIRLLLQSQISSKEVI
ncbi:MAG TPA: methanogenesis marker 7 protein [Candidatus Deferrimicrobium sp.]|nr:methanogenesis marker 7 protein [Candidatus Deferrimicrobium sp.]